MPAVHIGSHTVIASGDDDLDDLNPIVSGAVTPHRTFDAEGFRVRHLSFGAGAVLAEHSAPDPVVISVVSGSVRFDVEEKSYELRSGALIRVDRDVPHVVTALEPSRLRLVLVG